MKASIALSILILLVASFFGWRSQTRLAEIRQRHEVLMTEAAAAGLAVELDANGQPLPVTKRQRGGGGVDKVAQAKDFANQLADFAKEMKNRRPGDEDEALQRRIFGIMEGMMALDASQLKVLVAELQARTDIDDDMRQGIVGFAIMTLANDHPQAAVALFTESSGKIPLRGMGEHVIRASLNKWAEKDLNGALEWVRKNADQHPEMVTDTTKMGLVQAMARQDPKMAFQLVTDLGMKDIDMVGRDVADQAKTPAERNAILEAMRDKVASMPTEEADALRRSVVRSLGMKAVSEGFDTGSAWLESAKLNETERKSISDSLHYYATQADTGKWMAWVGKNLPADQLTQQANNLVGEWTRQDYKAAGAWINAEPDGAVKNASVTAYATTVASVEPAAAAQWALTLPAGADRQTLLTNIYQQWKQKDAGAAATFARQQGLQE